MTDTIDFRQTTFLLSAAQLIQLPPDNGAEIAFAGRSNAGKSSALNAITDHKNLARASKTPGCTRLINIFSLTTQQRLVDLPGYGYAKVAHSIKERWQHTLEQYLTQRQCLRGLFLLTDSRHPLTAMDQQLVNWAQTRQLALHILLTKADKLSRGAALNTLKQIQQQLKQQGLTASVQLFSSLSKFGITEARQHILRLLNN